MGVEDTGEPSYFSPAQNDLIAFIVVLSDILIHISIIIVIFKSHTLTSSTITAVFILLMQLFIIHLL